MSKKAKPQNNTVEIEKNLMIKLQLDGKDWKVKRGRSIFTNRANQEDVRIDVESDHGAKDVEDGKYYTTMCVLTAESGAVLRKRRAVPKEISMDFLRNKGFIGKNPECGARHLP